MKYFIMVLEIRIFYIHFTAACHVNAVRIIGSKQSIGYIVLFAGIAVIALTYEAVQKALGVVLPPMLNKTTLLSIAAVLIVLGVLLAVKKSSNKKKVAEVPIYHEKEVVGFRRIQK